jgi:TP901 family phage tail tape measure protein
MANNIQIIIDAKIDQAQLKAQIDQMSASKPIALKITADKTSVDAALTDIQQRINSVTGIQNKIGLSKEDIGQIKTGYASLFDDINNKTQTANQQWKQYFQDFPNTLSSGLQKSAKESAGAFQEIFDKSEVSTKGLSDLEKQMVSLTPEVKNASQEFMSFGDQLALAGKKMFEWTIVGTAIFGTLHAIQAGIQDAINLNTQLTQISVAMNANASDLQYVATMSQDIAKSMGTSVNDVLQIAHVYANVNETAASIMEKTKQAALLANISGLTGAETTSALQGIQEQFGIADSGLSHINDTLVTIAQNLKVNFQTAIQGMSEGIQKAGTMAAQAGIPFEKFAAILGVTEEKSRQSGETIAQALKMIMARVGQIKSADVEVTGLDMSNAAQAMASVGVDELDKQTHQLRSMDDILSDLSKKWGGLTADEKANISFADAGTRQYSLFESIMAGWGKSTELANKALDNNGIALQQQQKFLDSTQGKMQQFGAAMTTMWQNMINGKVLGDIISAGTTLINVFGNLNIAVALLTTAFLIWKGTALTGVLTGIAAYITEFGLAEVVTAGFTTIVDALTISFDFLNAAIIANPFGALAVAITTVIGIFYIANSQFKTLDQKIAETQQKIKDLNNQALNLEKQKGQLQPLIDTYNELKNKVSLTADEHQKLLDVTNQIATLSPDLVNGYDNEGTAILKNTGLMKDYINQLTESIRLNKVAQIQALETQAATLQSQADALLQSAKNAYNQYAPGTISGAANALISGWIQQGLLLNDQAKALKSQAGDIMQSILDLYPPNNNFGFPTGNVTSGGTGTGSGDGGSGGKTSLSDILTQEDHYTNLVTMAENQMKPLLDNEYDKRLKVLDTEQKAEISLGNYYKSKMDIAKANGLEDDLNKKILDTQGKIADIEKTRKEINQQIATDTLKKQESILKDQQSSIQNIVDLTAKMIKQQKEEELKNYKDIIDNKKKILDLTEQQYQYQKDLTTKQKDVTTDQNRLTELSRDNSRAAQAEKLKIMDDLSKKQTDLDDLQHKHGVDLQKQALDDDYAAFEKKTNDYLSQEGQIMSDARNMVSSMSTDVYNNLIGWNKQYGTTINDDITTGWAKAKAALNDYKDALGNVNASSALSNITQSLGTNAALQSGDSAAIISQMQSNSSLWKTASVSDRNTLHDLNVQLAQKIGATYHAADGRYYKDGVPIYHEGGFVGGRSLTPLNEQFAKLLKGEFVATVPQMSNFMQNVLPSVASGNSGNVVFNLNVAGNLDKSTLPAVQDMVNQAVDKINAKLGIRGQNRPIKSYAI